MNRRRGFTLTLVIVALVMVGVAMFVLTGGSNVMIFRADRDYLRAVERDLTASGLAWAKARVAADPNLPSGQAVSLDTTEFASPNAKLTVQILESHAGQAKVRIETSCTKGRRTLTASGDYTVGAP